MSEAARANVKTSNYGVMDGMNKDTDSYGVSTSFSARTKQDVDLQRKLILQLMWVPPTRPDFGQE